MFIFPPLVHISFFNNICQRAYAVLIRFTRWHMFYESFLFNAVLELSSYDGIDSNFICFHRGSVASFRPQAGLRAKSKPFGLRFNTPKSFNGFSGLKGSGIRWPWIRYILSGSGQAKQCCSLGIIPSEIATKAEGYKAAPAPGIF